MIRHSLLALLTLVASASCVPVEHPAPPPQRKLVSDPRALLRKLALDVPADVAQLARDLPRSNLDNTAEVLQRPAGAPAFLATARSEADAARASDCLTSAIYYEARSEPVDGQRAVAQVVLNRVRDRAFPNTVCGVVYQGSHRRTGCQFSFTCDGSLFRRPQPFAWARARAVADAALAGGVYAPVGSATHYHANYVMPWWAPSLARIGAVGAHVFYRWRGAMERALAFRQDYAGWEPEIGAPSVASSGEAQVASGGVSIHYGNAETGLVTVHRDAKPAGATPALVMASGVRVHRNGALPDHDGLGEDAIISDEPI
jgi:spore germination cell wall hydrolase CwlJ-like protein